MTSAYLIYHPKRQITIVGDLAVHHDKFGGNEDPYLWHNQFLHTYCHITQLKNNENQINFWIAGDRYPNFTQLFCDCVFTIAEKKIWTNNNFINPKDPIVDNEQTFEHHYQWANKGHHRYARRKRYTLKADRAKSFQPQDSNGNLIDILPFLNEEGISTSKLISSMTSKKGSRPMRLDNDLGQKLYHYLFTTATNKLFGEQLKDIHPHRKQPQIQKASSLCC